jgi:hypothetical protein
VHIHSKIARMAQREGSRYVIDQTLSVELTCEFGEVGDSFRSQVQRGDHVAQGCEQDGDHATDGDQDSFRTTGESLQGRSCIALKGPVISVVTQVAISTACSQEAPTCSPET